MYDKYIRLLYYRVNDILHDSITISFYPSNIKYARKSGSNSRLMCMPTYYLDSYGSA